MPEDDGGARHLVPGLLLPDIALASTRGGTMSLARQEGRAVLYVYTWTGRPGAANPTGWDNIPGAHGSTPESEGFRDLYGQFSALATEVFGLSAQTTAYQQEFAARLDLPFALLSDRDLALQRALSLPTFEAGRDTYLKRLTLLIRDGAIERTIYPVQQPDRHAAEVLAWLKSEMR
jgi:peroxiredoxin